MVRCSSHFFFVFHESKLLLTSYQEKTHQQSMKIYVLNLAHLSIFPF